MKAAQFLAIAALVTCGTIFMTSCYREDNNYPNNSANNYNSNPRGYTKDSTYTASNPYVFDEEFNGPDYHNWTFTDSTDSAYAGIINGSYEYVDYSTTYSNMSVVNTGASVTNNFTVSTRIKSNKIMGLLFGGSSTDNGYAFYIDTAGNYSLYKEGIGTTASTVIIPSTQDSLYSIKNNWNVLELDQTGGNWTGFINGTQVFQMSARTMTGANCGFKVLPGTTGFADYLVVKSY